MTNDEKKILLAGLVALAVLALQWSGYMWIRS